MSLNCFAETTEAKKKTSSILHINQADKINYGEFTRIMRREARRNEVKHFEQRSSEINKRNVWNEFQWCYHKPHVVASIRKFFFFSEIQS